MLTTVRMNYHLNALPEGWGFVLFLYVACALLGLCGARNERDTLLLGSTLLYLLAFCVVGRKENMYWGLMVAPLLAFGLGRAHFVIRAWLKAGGSVSLAKAWG